MGVCKGAKGGRKSCEHPPERRGLLAAERRAAGDGFRCCPQRTEAGANGGQQADYERRPRPRRAKMGWRLLL